MVTIFSTAKPFVGHFGIIQGNALRSWSALVPDVEVIVFGDDDGTSEMCAELGFRHVPDVETNEYGTPLVGDMFARAQAMANHAACCFVNADIILLPELLEAVERVSAWSDRYFIVGRRRDIDLDQPLQFDSDWQERLRSEAALHGELMPEVWIDYFVFPTGTVQDIPAFAMGRSGYDNWLIWHAGNSGLPVVDVTPYFTVIHQRHDYSHGGGKKAIWEGPEAKRQRSMISHWSHMHSVSHARYMLDQTGAVVPSRGLSYRLARPRRVASHWLRFTRPIRRRLAGQGASRG
jgi:hypothetical protein